MNLDVSSQLWSIIWWAVVLGGLGGLAYDVVEPLGRAKQTGSEAFDNKVSLPRFLRSATIDFGFLGPVFVGAIAAVCGVFLLGVTRPVPSSGPAVELPRLIWLGLGAGFGGAFVLNSLRSLVGDRLEQADGLGTGAGAEASSNAYQGPEDPAVSRGEVGAVQKEIPTGSATGGQWHAPARQDQLVDSAARARHSFGGSLGRAGVVLALLGVGGGALALSPDGSPQDMAAQSARPRVIVKVVRGGGRSLPVAPQRRKSATTGRHYTVTVDRSQMRHGDRFVARHATPTIIKAMGTPGDHRGDTPGCNYEMGVISKPVHYGIEPAIDSLASAVHAVNCEVIVPVEQAVGLNNEPGN